MPEIKKPFIKELVEKVSPLLKKKVLEVENNYYISLAVVLSEYKIPTKMYNYYASRIGKELNKRKQLKKQN